MVRHGENGLIYEMRNFSELAEMISSIADSPTLYEKMSENALKRFKEELNSERMAKDTLKLYGELYSEYLRGRAVLE